MVVDAGERGEAGGAVQPGGVDVNIQVRINAHPTIRVTTGTMRI